MSSFEFNKVFAAVLVAGIVAMLASFIARKIVHPHELYENAVEIAGGEVAAGPISKAPQFPEPILHLIASADVARGEKLSRACAACHSFDQGGGDRVGPNLWDTVGNTKGHIDGFAYSQALLDKGGDWNYASLNYFMWKPKDYIPGTKMNFIGLKKPKDRAAIIAWMRTKAASPAAMPSQAEIDEEIAMFAPPEPEPEVSEDGPSEGQIEEVVKDVESLGENDAVSEETADDAEADESAEEKGADDSDESDASESEQ